ncbi:hypothetical protein Ana3638_24340 [Anaerocolumna sedimenticola]|uniref:DUF6774 domain-containing protein n=1 Tax=Anaerocolumna sedimenticola TaxID=2696063 RepID=A0A6P1TQH8_9FIRM|nr:DUF6774 domain-containing protein [Anaerocolumna sedimenticola]QHQ63520.1 hypothetical protein Ana3638_24340 [Anaerocolumna sedimenticola]
MQSCELVATITAIACAIANNCSQDEISVLSSAFNQLGDTLGTIVAQEALNNDRINTGNNQQCSSQNQNTYTNQKNSNTNSKNTNCCDS